MFRHIKNPRRCINCKWCAIEGYSDELFDETANYDGYDAIYECHRYPKTVDVCADDWCGEFANRYKAQLMEEVE